MRKIKTGGWALVALVVVLLGVVAACSHGTTNNYLINAPSSTEGGASPNPQGNGCQLQVTQQEVLTPNGSTTISGIGSTMTLQFQEAAGTFDIPNNPCLNGTPVNWTATGTPQGACVFVGPQGGTSNQVKEVGTGSCSVCASATTSVQQGCVSLTLQ